MKRFRRRYVLLSFSSSSEPISDKVRYIDELLDLHGIRASLVLSGSDFLVYGCSHRSIDSLRTLFPLALSGENVVVIKGVSGTLRSLRRNFMPRSRKHLS